MLFFSFFLIILYYISKTSLRVIEIKSPINDSELIWRNSIGRVKEIKMQDSRVTCFTNCFSNL